MPDSQGMARLIMAYALTGITPGEELVFVPPLASLITIHSRRRESP
jgi:hypothetical protein